MEKAIVKAFFGDYQNLSQIEFQPLLEAVLGHRVGYVVLNHASLMEAGTTIGTCQRATMFGIVGETPSLSGGITHEVLEGLVV